MNLEHCHLSRGGNIRFENSPKRSVRLPKQKVPQNKEIVGWKKLQGGLIAKLIIPKDARRVQAFGENKARAEYAIVKSIKKLTNEFGGLLEKPKFVKTGKANYSVNGKHLVYRVGEKVVPDKYDPNPFVQCSHGIHFYLTENEARSHF